MLPENILIDGDKIYLSGFNNSTMDLGNMEIILEKKLKIFRGCREYLSPEWLKNSEINYLSDIYNIGILMYLKIK